VWLRQARWAVAVAAVISVGAGLIWVYRSAVQGDVPAAAAGAAICIGAICLEIAAAGVLRQAVQGLRSARRLDELEQRLAELEELWYAPEEASDPQPVAQENAAALVAASLDRDVYPRLIPLPGLEEQLAGAGKHTTPEESPDQIDRELDELVHREMLRLRDEFVGFVRRSDFAGALQTGDRIVALFPDSALATDYQTIRERLVRRVPGEATGERATAG